MSSKGSLRSQIPRRLSAALNDAASQTIRFQILRFAQDDTARMDCFVATLLAMTLRSGGLAALAGSTVTLRVTSE